MLTPEQLIDRVRDAVDGAEVDAGPRDTNLAILKAGLTLCGIALCRLDEPEREYQLGGLEICVRQYLAALAEAAWRRAKLH
jgi:hypothetical protein